MPSQEKENLFVPGTAYSNVLYMTSSTTGNPTQLTGGWFQSAPIAVVPGEKLLLYGNFHGTVNDTWISIIDNSTTVSIDTVVRCFRIFKQNTVNNTTYYIFYVPEDAQWISVSGGVGNINKTVLYRIDGDICDIRGITDIYSLKDPFAVRFDKVMSMNESQKSIARTNLGLENFASGNTITPQAYGAVGDGTVDDTEALQAAFDSNYKQVYLPPGAYKITESLTISKANKWIMGNGGNVARIIPTDECDDAILIEETAAGTHLHGFLIETTNNQNAFAIRILNTPRVSISFVDNLGGSFRESKSKWLHQEGSSWSTLMVYHCIVDCGTTDSVAAELINTSNSARICDVHLVDIFLDTVLADSGGCLRVDKCDDVHVQNSLYRSKSGYCVRLDNGSRVINEMSVLETFTSNIPSVVVNSGTFQNRGGWNDNYNAS